MKVDNYDLYNALKVIKKVCKQQGKHCTHCPLAIEIHKINSNNQGYSFFDCRLWNRQHENVPKPEDWDLTSPTTYKPFEKA